MYIVHMPKSSAQASASAARGESTRAQLLAAAGGLIAESGWGAVSTRMVAERAGVNPALVHYHFRSLPALLREAAMVALGEAFRPAIDAFAAAPSVGEGLTACMDVLEGQDWSAESSGVVLEAAVQATRDAHLAERVAEMLVGWRGALAERIDAERAAGTLPPDTDPQPLAVALAAFLDGLLLHRLIDPGLPMGAAGRALVALLRPRGTAP